MKSSILTLRAHPGRFLALFIALPSLMLAQPTPSGVIEGRVINPATGEYTEMARILVEGTTIEAFTDVDGRYRLSRVPSGEVKVVAFYTGANFAPQTVRVTPGTTTRADFEWQSLTRENGVVTMDRLEISASKEMSSAAVAINTQRFAPNTMTVLAADEFGAVSSYNIANVLTNVPGVTVGIGGLGDPFSISLNGVPAGAQHVPITVNGMQLAGPVERSVAPANLSINNMSRLEIAFTPTPETPGAALAGTVNMVPRSAFDRAKPSYSFDAGLVMRDRDRRLTKTPGFGGRDNESHKVNPQGSFAAVVPLNERFGFTVSGSATTTMPSRVLLNRNWRGLFTDTNGAAYPDTTPDKPYLWSYNLSEGIDEITRRSLSGSVDLKVGRRGRLSYGLQYGQFNIGSDLNNVTYSINRVAPGGFGDNFTQSAPGQGQVSILRTYYYRRDTSWLNMLNYWHDGDVWKIEGGLGYSTFELTQTYQSGLEFADTRANLRNATIRFDNTQALVPTATVTTSAGVPIDPTVLSNYQFGTNYKPAVRNYGHNRKAFGSIQRDFDWRLPLRVKAGFSVDDVRRDQSNSSRQFTFVGPDGIANSADDFAGNYVDPELSARPTAFGFPQTQWIQKVQITDYYLANPSHFTTSEVAGYNTIANNSRFIRELISAGYIRADTSLMEGRLKVVGGLRAEQTNIEGEGNLIDATANYQRDAAGNVLRGSNGQPLLIHPAGSLEATQLTNQIRGSRAEKEYLRWFPSLNATYAFSDNFLVRGGYFQSVGRPSFTQYAGSLTLPNLESPPSNSNRISVNNVGIKAWQAESYKLSLEYYFQPVGLFQVSGFVRDIKNFFTTTVFAPTPEFLAQYSLDPTEYGDYEVSTQYNVPGSLRMNGFSADYKQSLTFLPDWARGLQVFGNYSYQRATGEEADNFAGYIPRSANWGVTLTRPKFTLRVRWNYESRSRQARIAPGRSIGPDVYNWRDSRLLLTLSGEYRISKNYAFFFDSNNTTDEPLHFDTSGPQTPEWAARRMNISNVRLLTIGIKGNF